MKTSHLSALLSIFLPLLIKTRKQKNNRKYVKCSNNINLCFILSVASVYLSLSSGLMVSPAACQQKASGWNPNGGKRFIVAIIVAAVPCV